MKLTLLFLAFALVAIVSLILYFWWIVVKFYIFQQYTTEAKPSKDEPQLTMGKPSGKSSNGGKSENVGSGKQSSNGGGKQTGSGGGKQSGTGGGKQSGTGGGKQSGKSQKQEKGGK